MHNRGSTNILPMLEKGQETDFQCSLRCQVSQVSPVLGYFLCGQVCNSELSPAAHRYLYNQQGKEGGKEGREVKREEKTLGGRRGGHKQRGRQGGGRESHQMPFWGQNLTKQIHSFELSPIFSLFIFFQSEFLSEGALFCASGGISAA